MQNISIIRFQYVCVWTNGMQFVKEMPFSTLGKNNFLLIAKIASHNIYFFFVANADKGKEEKEGKKEKFDKIVH